MTRNKDPEYEISSGNVFADLGLADADELLTRAQLGHTVRMILKGKKLKQREIAKLLGIDQAEVSKLMNGQYHLFAEGRLFAFLRCLEQKVTIRVSRHRRGEPYQEVVARMLAAVYDARDAARGHEAAIVSHQLPIWITRLSLENRSFLHDPRRRQCTLCSITSLQFTGDRLTTISYSEPAGDLIPVRDKRAPFSAGNAPEARKP